MKITKILFTFFFLFSPLFGNSEAESGPKYYVSICSFFRDEARFLKEWIEYHRMIGIEHFYLFNHLSNDDYQTVLQPYIEKGIVELFHPTQNYSNHSKWEKIQLGGYNKIINEKKHETFWLAFIDSDEFIVPIIDPDFPSFLRKYEQYGGVCINWQTYGTSNIQRIPENQTMIGTLLRKAKKNDPYNKWVKSIVQPERVKHFVGAHRCLYTPPFFAVNERGIKNPNHPKMQVEINAIRINHYTYRDEEFYYKEKAKRYKSWFNRTSPPLPKYSEVEDPIMLKYVPELEERLFGDFYEKD